MSKIVSTRLNEEEISELNDLAKQEAFRSSKSYS